MLPDVQVILAEADRLWSCYEKSWTASLTVQNRWLKKYLAMMDLADSLMS